MRRMDLSKPFSEWAESLDAFQWSALILDGEWRLQWVSSSLRSFLGVGATDDVGFGLNLAQAWMREEWQRTASPESQLQLFLDIAPVFVGDMLRRGRDPLSVLDEPFRSLVDQVEPQMDPLPFLARSSFEYLDPADPDLPPVRVNFCAFTANDEHGTRTGIVLVFFSDVNPNLMTLLVRGDRAMYERMARLVEPGAHEAAVLFCDLHQSGRLSRELPTGAYFKLVRQLWRGIDAAIAAECGIVGKHAGDGASAFFLEEDLGSASHAAAAAVRAARQIHATSAETFGGVSDEQCLMKVGIHWGAGLYMGQLVPGGRLDVTALGDEVNEAVRVQETAEPGRTLTTKQLLERLKPDDAAALGLDLDKARFKILGDLPTAADKARRDAGGLAVTWVE